MNDIIRKKLLLHGLPNRPGVYIMRDASNRIIYVGKAASLKERVKSYFADSGITLKNSFLVKTVRSIDYVKTRNEKDALVLEESLIKRFQPKYNVIWKDDKRYPYIKITDDKFPRMDVVRIKKNDGGIYLGPYPDADDMRKTLKSAGKIFGLRPCKYDIEKRKKECLYYFIKKCPAPCIGKIGRKDYGRIVAGLVLFLRGKNQRLLKLLKKEMLEAKRKLQFEEAARVRNIIFAVKNTLEQVNIKEVELKDILIGIDKESYVGELAKLLGRETVGRIEGYDISNISGKFAVGSMVVFNDGAPDKKEYRKFRIKAAAGKIDDFAMTGEIIKRRFGGSLAPKTAAPDLIIIDGGPGQLNAARTELLKRFGENKIPKIIAIAKKNEELFFPGNPRPLVLSKNSLALNLIKYVRDEAHRFAVSYHKLLRAKIPAAAIVFLLLAAAGVLAREGTVVLKNGNVVKGNITVSETGDYTVETKKWSVLFSKKEVKSVKYTGREKPDRSAEEFAQKMKNTKKNLKYEKKKNYDYDPLIHFYSDKYNLDPAFVKAVVEAESNFNTGDISCKGAIGLMQLMPKTAAGLKVDPNDVEGNIDGGVKYLNYMYEKFGDSKLALAGYNAGPNAVKKYGKVFQGFFQNRKL